jgi:hypothetical protein
MNWGKMFRIAQAVFVPGDHFTGLVTKTFFPSEGHAFGNLNSTLVGGP